MDLEELKRHFAQTLDDGRLSRGERQALAALLDGLDLSPADRLALLGSTFDVARDKIARRGDREVLDWAESMARLLFPLRRAHHSEACFAPRQDCVGRLRRLFDEAASSVDVCVFTITDDSIARAVLHAHRRGVTVRLITDDEKAFDRGSDVFHLAEAGVPVRMDASADHMHHKFAIFDRGVLVTGSYNWTRSAASRNHENLALTDDRRLVAAFGEEFERLWASFGPPAQAR